MTYGLGWIPDLERQHKPALASLVRPLCAAGDSSEWPQSVDAGKTIAINNQRRRNSCPGNAVDVCLQRDHQLSTGIVVNTSAWYSYLAARMADGNQDSRDAGASISGAVLAARDYGAVLEKDFPYPADDDPFDPRIPGAVLRLGELHRCGSVTEEVWSWSAMLPAIATGQAQFVLGIWWTDELASYSGQAPIQSYRNRGTVGGHAIACFEYVWCHGGERWPVIRNSHSEQWGDRGRAIIAPQAFDAMLQAAPFGARGLTKLPAFTKRKLDLIRGLAG